MTDIMPTDQPQTPSTEAGRIALETALVVAAKADAFPAMHDRAAWTERILAIEAEAVKPWREVLLTFAKRTMPDGLPCWCVSGWAPHEGWIHGSFCKNLRALTAQLEART